jgi:hypothetical protein
MVYEIENPDEVEIMVERGPQDCVIVIELEF